MAHDAKRSGKADGVGERQLAEAHEPVDARTTMWRAVKLYAWLATLGCAVWGLWVATVYVYRQPPSCPANPLRDASTELLYGMSEMEVRAIIKSHTHDPSSGRRYDHGLDCEPAMLGQGTTGSIDTSGGLLSFRRVSLKMIKWDWIGNLLPDTNGGWCAVLSLAFENDALCSANYSDVWMSHIKEHPMEYRAQKK